jgi:hypothetical protein
MTLVEIAETWEEEANDAKDCIVEILESYMEFVDIMERTLNCYAEMPDKIELMAKTLINDRRQSWQPILDKLKSDLEKVKKE